MDTSAVVLLVVGFAYSAYASVRAYQESGQKWMLFLPQWIDASRGVSPVTKHHGMAAFALLFVGFLAFVW